MSEYYYQKLIEYLKLIAVYPYHLIKSQSQTHYNRILIAQLVIGSALIFKTFLFAKRTAEKYRLQALSNQKKDERQQQFQKIQKKYLKKLNISQDKERSILNMTVPELQLKLVQQYIQNEQNNNLIEPINIQDVIAVYLQKISQDQGLTQFGEINFQNAIEDALIIHGEIINMLMFLQQVEQNQHKNDKKENNQVDFGEEELKENEELKEEHQQELQAPQSQNPFDMEEKEKKKNPFMQILEVQKLLGFVIIAGDSIQVEDLPNSYGLIQNSLQKENQDSEIINILKNLGGIVLGKSNCSMGHIPFIECQNDLWGGSVNPWNNKRISGTSSDCSLIAQRYANLAISEDLIGEQRINAMFNGVYTFCSSSQRVPYELIHNRIQQIENKIKGPQIIRPRVSFTARKVEEIKLVLSSLMGKSEQYSKKYPQVSPIQFNEDIFYGEKQLKVGYYDSLSIFESCSSVRRAVLTSYGHLTSLGYELIKINEGLPYFQEIFQTFLKIYFNTNFISNKALWTSEEEQNSQFTFLKDLFNKKSDGILSGFFNRNNKRRIMMNYSIRKIDDSGEILRLLSELQITKQKALKDLKQIYNCDVYLGPVFPVVAPLKDNHFHNLIPAFAYTIYWNVLDMPCGVVPQGLVNSDEANYHDFSNDHYEYHARLTMQNSAGMPVGVQVAGNCNQDELVLRVMRELQDKIKFKLPIKFDQQ